MSNNKLTYNGQDIRARKEKLNLTDMWKAAGSPSGKKKPSDWLALESTRQFVEHLETTLGGGSLKETTEGRQGATWAHWHLALAYARYLDHDFHVWCNEVIRREMSGVAAAPDGALVARLEKLENIVARPGEADLGKQVDRVMTFVLKLDETLEGLKRADLVGELKRLTAYVVETRLLLTHVCDHVGFDPDDVNKLPGRRGTLREFPVDRKAMQLLIARTARGLGWRFGVVQARLASTLGVKSYLYMEIGRLDEARRVLADMMYRTTQQAAEKSEAEHVRDQQRKVYEVAMSDKKTLN